MNFLNLSASAFDSSFYGLFHFENIASCYETASLSLLSLRTTILVMCMDKVGFSAPHPADLPAVLFMSQIECRIGLGFGVWGLGERLGTIVLQWLMSIR